VTDQPPRFALHDDLYALVVYLHAGSNRDLWDSLAADRLSISQAKLLDRLRAGRRPTVGQAARLIGVTSPSMVRMVQDLAERGYVRREHDEGDKRTTRIIITDRGDEAIQHLHAARLAQIVQFTDELDVAEQAEWSACLAPAMARQEISQFRPVPLPA
jgi:MarR family transcriptional regulator, transcriptional regulator for hemolysin